MAQTIRPLDLAQTYIALSRDGAATPHAGGPAFWSLPDDRLQALGGDWLVSEFVCDADWPSWEMHPDADEMVYLVEGDADLLLEMPEGVQTVRLCGRGAVIVPQGIWHTAHVRARSRLLHITMGKGTQSRPAAR